MNDAPRDKSAGRRWAALAFVLACGLAWLLELTAEHLLAHQGNLAGPLFNLGGIYQTLVTSGPRKPIQKFTVLSTPTSTTSTTIIIFRVDAWLDQPL